jgi:glycosyltransferase involved in cell wall biosynthesis
MRIAMIGSRGIGSGYGGIERVLDDLCPHLVALGHEIDVYSSRDARPVSRPGLRSIPTSCFGGKHFETISRSAMALTASIGRYDLIHFHAIGPGILSSITRTFGQKAVVTIHGLDHQRDKWGTVARFCLTVAERSLVSSADAITVVSADLQRYFLRRYATSAVHIPNGRPERKHVAPGKLLAELGLTPGRYVLFASRLTPEKGCHDLIAAFNDLDTDMHLVIAGGAKDSAYFAALRAQVKTERIAFIGHRSGDELAELFTNPYLFVLPSYMEGMSLALLEAIGYGLPVLVSDIPENREVVGDSAFYFPPRDVAALRAALRDILDERAFVDLSARRLAGLPHASWGAVARSYDALYREVVQPARLRAPVPAAE